MTEAVQKAARWLATTPQDKRPHPVVPFLQREFGLSPKEACEACREAQLIRARAH